MTQQVLPYGTKVELDEKVLSLIRADGTCHFETNINFDEERANFGRIPKGWQWVFRTAHRTGTIGRQGGFCETSVTYSAL